MLLTNVDERDGAEAIRLALIHSFKQFDVFNISSGSPFSKEDLFMLKFSPLEVIIKYYPEAEDIYKKRGWTFPNTIDRVYNSDKARAIFGYTPKYTFDFLLYI